MADVHRLNNYNLPGPLSPLGNNVMVKPNKVDDKSTGGLFLATEQGERPKDGVVVSAGPGKTHPDSGVLHPCPVKVGDLVMLNDFSGDKVEYDGEKHIFVNADTLLGYFEGRSATVAGFRPLRDRVLVAKEEVEEATASGIALAGAEEDDANSGEVVCCGPGRLDADAKLLAMSVTPHDHVMYDRYSGSELTLEDKKFKLVSEADCIAKW